MQQRASIFLAVASVQCLLPVSAAATTLTCAPPPFDDLPEIVAALEALTPILQDYPVLFETLDRSVAEICLADGPLGARGYYEPETRRLVLSGSLDDGLRQAVLIHELRHVQQFGLGACPSPDLSMESYAEAVFAMEADASVTSLVIADALRSAGHPAMWDALASWPMQADISASYDDALDETGQISAAASAAFDAWFEGEVRRNAYYIATCMDYLEQTERDHRLPSYKSLSPAFYDALCTLPDGQSYACSEPR